MDEFAQLLVGYYGDQWGYGRCKGLALADPLMLLVQNGDPSTFTQI